jgi:hypothetical protein
MAAMNSSRAVGRVSYEALKRRQQISIEKLK